MMGLCYLLTVLCFLKASGENRSRAWQLGTIASFLCGVGVKENIVTAPVFCLLIDQVLLSGSLRSAWRRNRYTYVMFLLGFGVFAIVALAGGLQDRMALNSGTHDYVRHLWIQVRAVGHYLQLACWPSPLIFDHGIDLDVLDRISLPFGLMVTGGLVLGASLTYLRYPALSLLPVWFLITLAPTTSLIPVYGAPVAENRVYLASIAVSITSVIVASIFLHRRAVAPLACALIALGVITHRRNDDYRDRVCLWNDTVAKTPGNHRALGWSGIALLATPDGVREGINRLEAARRMRPGSADTNCNLGRAYLQIGDFRRAILYFREALALRPNDAFAHIGLSVALRQSGEPVSQAIAHAKAAVQCRPDRVDFSSVLGALLLDAGLVDESTKELERAVRLNEQFTQAHMNLGNAYMATPGRLDEAVASYRRALELSPSSFAILFNLGNALLQQGANLREAESCYERTLEINPEYKPARDKLESIRSRMNSGTGGTQRPRLGTN